MSRARLAIVMEGGVVNSVVTDDPALVDLPVLVIEYEKDEEAIPVLQPDGHEEQALVGVQRIEKSKIELGQIWVSMRKSR